MASRKRGSGSKKKGGSKDELKGGPGLKLIQHKHCQICGRAQLMDDGVVCSDACQKTLDDNIKRKKMWWIYLALLLAVLVIFYVVMFLVN
jgi:predicted nucleic acid-binding Zn ribbon protein